MNLALFKVNNLGDNIVFLPVVQALRKRFPDWRLMVFTSPAAAAWPDAPAARIRLWTGCAD